MPAFRPLLVAACLLTVVIPTSARAEEPTTPFATLSAQCSSSRTGAPLFSPHPRAVVRYTEYAGGGIRNIKWDNGRSYKTNDAPSFTAWCDSGSSSVTAEFFDQPGLPATYRGRGATRSYLGFTAPATGRYALELTLAAGAVEIRKQFGGMGERYASSTTIALGELTAGEQTFVVEGLEGAPPEWTATIRQLPPSISGVRNSATIARPGTTMTGRYSTDGDTLVDIAVRDVLGRTVRSLATQLSVDAGERSVTWDGTDAAGAPLPDGAYTLIVSNGTSVGTSTVTLDGTPPAIALASPAAISPGQSVTGQIADPAGLDSASIQVDDEQSYYSPTYSISDATQTQPTFTVKPRSGTWSVGAHALTVTARDDLGNVVTRKLPFTVVAPDSPAAVGTGRSPAAPRCSKTVGGRLAKRSRTVRRKLRGGNTTLKLYGVNDVTCADLDRDGAKDMLVYLSCCTVSSTRVLVIYRNVGGRWKESYVVAKTFYRVQLKGRRVILWIPRFERSDANCCPSSYRKRPIFWTGGRFKLRR